MPTRSFIFFIALSFATFACSRTPTASPADAGGELDATQSTMPSATATATATTADAGFTITSVSPGEAKRSHIAKLSDPDPALHGSAVTDALAKHFKHDGGASDTVAGFDVQAVDLTARGRRAVLVMEAGHTSTSDARSLLVIADDQDRVVWSRRPIGGIMAPVGPVAIAAAPRGRIALAACDPPTNIVALRIFDDDGSPFADFQALAIEPTTGASGCEALSLLYWPKHGWIVTIARAGSTRARLFNEDGGPSWSQPLDLGARSRAGAIAHPVLAVDTDDTFVLVQVVQPDPGVATSPFHALAFRYDLKGTAIWPAAVDLGESARGRVSLAQMKPGVRVTFPGSAGTAAGQEKEVDLKPSGDVTPRFRAPR